LIGVVILLLGLSIGLFAFYYPLSSTSTLNSTFSTPVSVDPNDFKSETLSMTKGEVVNYAMQLDNATSIWMYIMNSTQYSIFLKCAPKCAQPLLGGKGTYYEQAGLSRPDYFLNVSISESKPYKSNFTAPTSGTFFFVFDNSIGGNWSSYLGQNATGFKFGTIKMTVFQIATTYAINWDLMIISVVEIILGGVVTTVLWTPRVKIRQAGKRNVGFMKRLGTVLVAVAIVASVAINIPIYYSAATGAKTFVPVGTPKSSGSQTGVVTTEQASNYSIFEIDSDYLSNIGPTGYGQMSVDSLDQFLFITAGSNNSIYIYDLPDEAESDVAGFNNPQGVLYVANYTSGVGELFVSNTGNGTVDLLSVNNTSYPIELDPLTELSFPGADYLAYDNSSNLVYVSYQGGLGIINPVTNTELGTIPLSSKPGQIVIEQNGTNIFVTTSSGIDVIDKTTRNVISSWPLSGSTALALDETDNQLFAITSTPPSLKVLDDQSGSVLSTLSLPSAAGDVGYDPESGLVFASCSNGTLQVYQPDVQNPGSYILLTAQATGPSALSSVFYPAQEQVFVAIPEYPYQLAQLMTFGIYAD
jgi:hypothetical protein